MSIRNIMYSQALEFKIIVKRNISDQLLLISEMTNGLNNISFKLESNKKMVVTAWSPGEFDMLEEQAKKLESEGEIEIVFPK